MVDASGVLVASSAADQAGSGLPIDLDSLVRHREEHDPTFRISAPVDFPDVDELLIVASFAVRNASGQFLGLVGALLSATHFLGEFEGLKPSTLTRLTLARSDGQILMRIPRIRSSIRVPEQRMTSLWRQLENGGVTTEATFSPEDGRPNLATFRRVDGYDLYVAVTVRTAAMQSEWWQALDESHAAQARSEARLRDATDSMLDGFSLWDAKGNLMLWNARYAELHPTIRDHLRVGVSFAELTDLHVRQTADPGNPAERERRLAEYTDLFHQAVAHDSYGASDGRIVNVTRARTAEGGIVSIHRDVTQALATQRAIVESEARFHDGIESMGEGFALWDAQDRLLAWNKRMEVFFPAHAPEYRPGLPFSRIIELLEALTPTQPDQQAWAEAMAQRRDRRQRLGETIRFSTPTGRQVEFVNRATSDGGIVSIYRDVTDERHLLGRLQASESELQRALVAEREMNAQQRRFISIASHEFRTPLAIIDDTAQRILARMTGVEAQDADTLKRMDRIRGSVSRMTDIIDRTLTTARLDEGCFEFEPASVDLGNLLQEVVIRQRSIVPSFAIEIDLPATAVVVIADAKLLELVFSNLISNAVKYSGKSRRVEVGVAIADAAVTIDVRDHGIGVPQDELQKLFTRFYRASTAHGIPGTGIGLHLAKELLQMHGGRIDAFSEVGRGSRFIVHLPRDRPVHSVAA